ncbi:MAG: HAMP domain-containing sensor histidine kinase, partial [Chloroflexota bacterium]
TATSRFGLFDSDGADFFGLTAKQWLIFYGSGVGILLGGYSWLIILAPPTSFNIFSFFSQHLTLFFVILVGFGGLQLIYQLGKQWYHQRLHSDTNRFEYSLDVVSRKLLTIKSWHDMENLMRWEIPTDFRLHMAHFLQQEDQGVAAAWQLSLKMNHVSLGNLFLGDKINNDPLTASDKAILEELQHRLSAVLWRFELDEAVHTTEELTRLRNRLLASITPEFDQLLQRVIARIEMIMEEEAVNDTQLQVLNQAFQAGETLHQTLQVMVDVNQYQANRLTLQWDEVNLAKLIDELKAILPSLVQEKPIEIEVDAIPNLPWLQADPIRLRQILLILLSNAAKFTERGFIGLKAYLRSDQVIIEVSDTGLGIDPQRLPTIFQPFIASSEDKNDPSVTAGLSLMLAKALVELHHGQIEMSSQPQQGTTVTLTFPVDHLSPIRDQT